MTQRTENLIEFFKENPQYVPSCGIFDTRNIVGDRMQCIYSEPADGVVVDICYDYDYIEIFGLTEDEFIEAKHNIEELYKDPWADEDDEEEDND